MQTRQVLARVAATLAASTIVGAGSLAILPRAVAATTATPALVFVGEGGGLPVTDNYKAVYNKDPAVREYRSWFAFREIRRGSVSYTPTAPPEGNQITIEYDRAVEVSGSDGTSALVTVSSTSADVMSITLRLGPAGYWGPLLALNDVTSIRSRSVPVTVRLSSGGVTLKERTVVYRYDDGLWNAPADSVEYNSPGGRWWVGCTRSRTNWEPASPDLAHNPPLLALPTGCEQDFNGDGIDDVAIYRSRTGTWSVNTGDGLGFRNWATYERRSWTQQRFADFNGDGMTDVANYSSTDGTWWVSLSNGSRFVDRVGEPPTAYAALWADYAQLTWKRQVIGDYNGDGMADIANFSADDGTWHVSLSTGTRFGDTAAAPAAYEGTWADYRRTSWTSQLAGDFNGDGRTDIANYAARTYTWYVSLSTGTRFGNRMVDPTSDGRTWTTLPAGEWSARLVGNFSGDQRASSTGPWTEDFSYTNVISRPVDDIANYRAGDHGHWYVSVSNRSSAYATADWGTLPSAASSWTSPLVGDYNGDGHDDIAVLTTDPSAPGRWYVSLAWTGALIDGEPPPTPPVGLEGTYFLYGADIWQTLNPTTGWESMRSGYFEDDVATNADSVVVPPSDIVEFQSASSTWHASVPKPNDHYFVQRHWP